MNGAHWALVGAHFSCIEKDTQLEPLGSSGVD